MRNKLFKVLIIIVALTSLCACKSKTIEFKEDNFKIKLPSDFKKKTMDTFTYYYQSDKAIITVINESYDVVATAGLSEDTTISEYLTKAMEKSGKEAEIQLGKNNAYISYDTTTNGNKYYHLCVAFKSNSGFWLVNYTCEEKYKKELSDEFLVWSESIEL